MGLPDGAYVRTYADAPEGGMKLTSGGASFEMEKLNHSDHTRAAGEAVVGATKEIVRPQIHRAWAGVLSSGISEGADLVDGINNN